MQIILIWNQYTTVTVVYILIIFYSIILSWTTIQKKHNRPRGYLNPRRRCQSADMLAPRPS